MTMLLACLAIAGMPPFAGFFSKDESVERLEQRTPLAMAGRIDHRGYDGVLYVPPAVLDVFLANRAAITRSRARIAALDDCAR